MSRNTAAAVRPVRLLKLVRLDNGTACSTLHRTAYLVNLAPTALIANEAPRAAAS